MKVHVSRLAGQCPNYMRPGFADAAPIASFQARPRLPAYDRGRVAYFRDLYLAGVTHVDVVA